MSARSRVYETDTLGSLDNKQNSSALGHLAKPCGEFAPHIIFSGQSIWYENIRSHAKLRF